MDNIKQLYLEREKYIQQFRSKMSLFPIKELMSYRYPPLIVNKLLKELGFSESTIVEDFINFNHIDATSRLKGGDVHANYKNFIKWFNEITFGWIKEAAKRKNKLTIDKSKRKLSRDQLVKFLAILKDRNESYYQLAKILYENQIGLSDALRLKDENSEYLFKTRTGKKIDRLTINRAFATVSKKSGLPKIMPSDLRFFKNYIQL